MNELIIYTSLGICLFAGIWQLSKWFAFGTIWVLVTIVMFFDSYNPKKVRK